MKSVYIVVFFLCSLFAGYAAARDDIRIAIYAMSQPVVWSSYKLEKDAAQRVQHVAQHLGLNLSILFLPTAMPDDAPQEAYDITVNGEEINAEIAVNFQRHRGRLQIHKRLLNDLYQPDNFIYIKKDDMPGVVAFVLLYTMAEHLDHEGQAKPSREILKLLLGNQPALQSTGNYMPLMVADTHFQYGRFVQSRHPQLAAKLYEKTVQVHPQHAAALYQLALMHQEQQQNQQAAQKFNQVLKIDESEIDAHYHLGNLRLNESNYASAERYYRNALDTLARDRQILALMRSDTKQVTQIKIQLTVLDKKTSLLQTGLGKACYFQKKYTEAKSAFDQALHLKADNAEARSYLEKMTM